MPWILSKLFAFGSRTAGNNGACAIPRGVTFRVCFYLDVLIQCESIAMVDLGGDSSIFIENRIYTPPGEILLYHRGIYVLVNSPH